MSRKCLFHKLLVLGLCGKFYKAVCASHNNLKSHVCVNDSFTEWFDVDSGVRQGDTLAPSLFALYLEDLITCIKNVNEGVPLENDQISILLYADDIVLISATAEGLQKQIDALHIWCRQWRMNVNLDKMKVVQFRRAICEVTKFKFMFNFEALEIVPSYRYLGLDINEHLDFSHSVSLLADAAGRALGSLVAKHRSVQGLPYETFTKVYKSTVVPVMDYASEIGVQKNTANQKMSKTGQCARSWVLENTRHCLHWRETCWTPPHIRASLDVVRLWLRLQSLPQTRLVRRIYDWDLTLARQGKQNWCKDLMKIFYQAGHESLVNEQFITEHEKCFVFNLIEQSLLDQNEQKWKDSVSNMPKLRTYALLKEDLSVPMYISSRLTPPSRSILARFRNGTYPLAVETGRYTGVPLDQRICLICSKNDIENEHHFLVSCEAYDIKRTYLYSLVNAKNDINIHLMSHDEQFKYLLSTGNIAKLVANYIRDCYALRNTLIK